MKFSTTGLRFVLAVACVVLVFQPTLVFATIHHLTILHTSDHNDHFLKFSPWGNPDVGGMAAQSTLINIVRAEIEQAGGHVLLLSAGNVNIGPAESNLLNAEPDFKLMKMLGYDAMTLGIYEFRPREVLRQQREWADFPFLSANMVAKETGKALDFVDPYIIREFDGLKVAIFGLILEEIAIIADPQYVPDLEFRNAVETARSLVPKLRAEADLVIALTHLGLDEQHTCCGRRGTTDIPLAQTVPGIDVIVGGNARMVLETPEVVGETLIVQGGYYGLYVGRLDLTIDSETNKITAYTYELIPVNLKKQVEYQGKFY